MPPSPLTVTLIQSTILNAISNVLAQLIDQYKENVRRILLFTTISLFPMIRVEVVVSWFSQNTPIQNQPTTSSPTTYLLPTPR
ncbi:hypothetical protein BDV40DRAFT_278468 [Aspergillus tamarii]|uniref:Uncharacterized protein n=1 Tax=Aspergillus tamarii TaxID=41984 RepID=A0A5N6UFZ3_ASPTM|nr:hypothetical protein BDV40DRAFT_278468 [Aspergillus tamarii]